MSYCRDLLHIVAKALVRAEVAAEDPLKSPAQTAHRSAMRYMSHVSYRYMYMYVYIYIHY
jgi:hypothetical protein